MDFVQEDRNKEDTLAALSFALLLGHSHSAQNPILYCIMNASFKRGMLAVMKCRRMNHSEISRVSRCYDLLGCRAGSSLHKSRMIRQCKLASEFENYVVLDREMELHIL